LAQGYEDVKDLSVYVKFKVKEGQKIKTIGKDFIIDNKTYILAWTTTPWTLPGNVALAMGEKIKYVLLKVKDEQKNIFSIILAEDIFKKASKDNKHPLYQYLSSFVGDSVNNLGLPTFFPFGLDLIGLEYEPLFPFLADSLPESEKSKLDKA